MPPSTGIPEHAGSADGRPRRLLVLRHAESSRPEGVVGQDLVLLLAARAVGDAPDRVRTEFPTAAITVLTWSGIRTDLRPGEALLTDPAIPLVAGPGPPHQRCSTPPASSPAVTEIRTIRGPAPCNRRTGPSVLPAGRLPRSYRRQTKGLPVSYSPKKLGFCRKCSVQR